MYELEIVPKIYTQVSPSVKKFIGSVKVIQKAEQKPYEYVSAGSMIETNAPALPPLPYNRHPYFVPTSIINRENAEVAKYIKILG